MNNLIYSDREHTGPMMNWLLNHRCNYTCEYCFLPQTMRSTEHPATGRYSPQHIADRFDSTQETWWVYLSGGEPFLYPEFVDLCARLTKNHFITVNTNLSTSNTIDFADSINPEQTFSINASLHIEEREMRNGLSKYLERVRYYQNKGFQIRVEYVMYPTLFQRIEDDLQMLKSEGVAIVNLKAFRGYFKSRYYPLAYSETEQEFIREHLLDGKEEEIMSIDKTFTFFGKPCRTGLDYWVMDPAGNVRRCCSSTKSYGNFFDESFQADRETRPCPFIKCAAPYEGMLYSSDTPVRTTSAIKECFLEAPSYIFQKARPSKLYRYVKKVTSR